MTHKLSFRFMQVLSSFSLLLALPLLAETKFFEIKVFEIYLKDHLFTPSTLYVPAGEKVKLVIHNQDPTPEEFESFSLNREKVILGHGKGVVFIGPLEPGEHPFIGEYNPDTARGTIVVLPAAQWLQKSAAATQLSKPAFLNDSGSHQTTDQVDRTIPRMGANNAD